MKNLTIHPFGLGDIIKQNWLAVPIYQRPYAWKPLQVRQLLDDIARAMSRGTSDDSHYFLGSIVVIQREGKPRLEIVDGQQRLATASFIYAYLRDYFRSIEDAQRTPYYDSYLQDLEPQSGKTIRRLHLNETDDDCYYRCILGDPTEGRSKRTEYADPSHRRLFNAFDEVRSYFGRLASFGNRQDVVSKFVQWGQFLHHNAQVVRVQVASDADAFSIFETLNDRGLDLTIADLLKNFIFGAAGEDALDNVRSKWSEMVGALKTAGTKKDRTVDFIRQLWGSIHGIIRGPDLFGDIRDKTIGQQGAIDFASKLTASAVHYSCILNTDHEIWNRYGTPAKNSLKAIRIMHLERLRPLLMALLDSMKEGEAAMAIAFLEAAAVRHIVAGTSAGTFETDVVGCAVKVRKKDIRTAVQLANELKDAIPNNSTFENAFAQYRTKKSAIARYLFQSLEDYDSGTDERKVTPDEKVFDIEHIIPRHDRSAWDLTPDKADDLCYRLGNMAIMRRKDNSLGRSAAYAVKRPFYEATESYQLTKAVAEKFPGPKWGEDEVKERQRDLASLAVKCFPLKPPVF
jgi:uncharacterized protein with ParB-like and HNH nuclease domain